jgi:hypothetical protein
VAHEFEIGVHARENSTPEKGLNTGPNRFA